MNFLQKSVAAWFQSYNFIKGPLQKLINNGLGAVQRGRDSINREHILSWLQMYNKTPRGCYLHFVKDETP